MKRCVVVLGVSLFMLLTRAGSGQNPPARSLEIYWIDVEGGAATLFVSPTGESLLFDTGFPGNGDRDAKRIHVATQKAGLKRIDHVVISHWHGDHVGGLEALAKMMPIGRFYDHGDGVEDVDRQRLDSYTTVAADKRTIVKAGDTIPFGGVAMRVLVSEGPVIAKPINGGGPNPLCDTATHMPPAGPENVRMVGLSLTYGTFKFASLADLDWSREMELACPINKLGTVNLYGINRHGGLDNSGAPALLGAIKPQVIVVNNGPRKGLGGRDDRIKPISRPGVTPVPYEQNSYLRMAKTPGVEDVWQGHLSMLDSDPAHNTARDMIANFEDNGVDHPGNLIIAAVGRDGRFTLTNTRNGFSKTYVARP
jgi:beta-lactamase superfamily II metal-dependent hydrolase